VTGAEAVFTAARPRGLNRTNHDQPRERRGPGVGDRVCINHDAKPNYLHGRAGTVTGWAGQNVIVQLDQPVGRFTTGQLRCPPLILEPLPPE